MKEGVEKSCGCIFCDIGLEPEGGRHHVPRENVYVTCKAVSDFTRVCTDMKILDADKIAE